MAVRIRFDQEHNVIQPTFVLATRSGKKLGVIQADDIQISDSMNTYFEANFKVYKENDGVVCPLWDKIEDFKLLWCREWDVWFEIYVETFEENNTVKHINAISLGEAETSNTKLYGIEINTETDISRDDYEVTVFFNEKNPKASLLHRIKEKLPHYSFGTIADSLMNIQRTFTFDGISFYDALQEIAKEINCIFVLDSRDIGGKPARQIHAYDLESYCTTCGYRDIYFKTCPNPEHDESQADRTTVYHGYGEDTTIFITTENLADNITFKTDKDSVMNCFRLEGGDDLMTATIMNCNPNGSAYIWYISEAMKRDMSEELVEKLAKYDVQYEKYQTEPIELPSTQVTAYNQLLETYNVLYKNLHDIPDDQVGLTKVTSPIVGYPALMNLYYDTIDMQLFLESELMPSPKLPNKAGATAEAAKLLDGSFTSISVQNIKNCSESTVTSSALSAAKVIIDKRYQVKTANETYTPGDVDEEGKTINGTWEGSFIVTSYSIEEGETDTSASVFVTLKVDGDYEKFVKHKLDRALNQKEVGATDIVSLFNEDLETFKKSIKDYGLSSLETFRDACQTCLDIMIEQGIADDETWGKRANESENNEDEEKVKNLHEELYIPYYKKNEALIEEIAVRENEIAVVIGTRDSDGDIITKGLQTIVVEEKEKIQAALDFERFLSGENGETVGLWHEFLAYRREDTYTNENYISDGLDNRELFDRALEFVENARKEIYKSSTLQHSITATLKNLLVMKEFETIVDYFAVGNWIRVKINDEVYRLRLLSYTIDFNNLDNISIEFSDVLQCANGISDVESILNQAASMTKGYPSISQQASKGNEAKKQIDDWVERSLALTKMKIVDDADNQNITWDSHGILCREYLPMSDTYDDKQLKIINKGLYLTNDNWETSKAAIGNFFYYDPRNGEMTEAYGVIADTLVGNLILSEEVGIYNMNNSITLDEKGLTITTHYSEDKDGNVTTGGNNAILIQKEVVNADGEPTTEQLMYIDDEGNLVLNGTIRVNTAPKEDGTIEDVTLNDICDEDRINTIVNNRVDEETTVINNTIEANYQSVMEEMDYQLNEHKAEVGQYMQYDSENGLTLGSTTTTNKTVIDNTGIRFKQGNTTVSYMTNSQLYIPNAIIENMLVLGKYCFCPREDGGFSLVWQEDVTIVDNEVTSIRIKSDSKTQTVGVGSTATFTAIGTGKGLKYQWSYKLPSSEEWVIGTEVLDDWVELEDESLQTTFTYSPSSIEDEDGTTIRIDAWDENGNNVYDTTKLVVVESGYVDPNEPSNGSDSTATIVRGEASQFNINIGSSDTSARVFYADDVDIVNGTLSLINPSNVYIYKEESDKFDAASIEKLYGKYACVDYVDGRIYYIDQEATFTTGNFNNSYPGVGTVSFQSHIVKPAYRVTIQTSDEGNVDEGGSDNTGGTETTSYTWEKYTIEQEIGIVEEKLDTTTRPSDAIVSYDENGVALWNKSYTIDENGCFVLSEETVALEGYAAIDGGDGKTIYKADWIFVLGETSYTDYYTVTISDSVSAKGEKVGVVTSNNVNDYPSNGEKDGYWYVLV